MYEVQLYQINPDQLWYCWERVPHKKLETLLKARDSLIVLSHGRPPYKVVLGVPHQAANGVRQICEQRRDDYGNIKARHGDCNAASFALVAFSRLRARNVACKLVIMAHATAQDPNKVLTSPYCREILRHEMQLLFECHASGPERSLDLELSAGSNQLTRTICFGRQLAFALGYRYGLGVQTVAGRNDALILQPDGTTIEGELQLPATKTASLSEASERGIPALHLEAKPIFRVPAGRANSVSAAGLILGRAIATTVSENLVYSRKPC